MADNEKFTGGWTLKTLFTHFGKVIEDLRDYLDKRFTDNDKAVQAALVAQEKAVSAALQAAKEAVNKAEVATEKRFESVNEFRAQLADQSNTLLPRAEYQVQHTALVDRFDALTKAIETRSDDVNKQLAALNLLIVGNPDIRKLQNDANAAKGQTKGSDITKSDFYRGLTLAVATITAIVSTVILLVHFG